jgi:hypothetical protein
MNNAVWAPQFQSVRLLIKQGVSCRSRSKPN